MWPDDKAFYHGDVPRSIGRGRVYLHKKGKVTMIEDEIIEDLRSACRNALPPRDEPPELEDIPKSESDLQFACTHSLPEEISKRDLINSINNNNYLAD